jgi:acetylornithine deacetylase/succinyl-diaminopimelate desuccinylase-like protein
VNLRIVFEGEEESTSASLPGWLEANRNRLGADAVIISDTGFLEGNRPALTLGLRGMVYVQIDVSGPTSDVHSGGYGGVVENPANALARIISELKDRDGIVQVPGFYDEVETLTPELRARIAAIPLDESNLLAVTGAPALVGEKGFTVLERQGYRPTLDVNGIWGGFQGHGSKTIIPARAHAKVSCRLVPNQDPDVIFERLKAFIFKVAPPGVNVEVTSLGGGRPTVVSATHPVAKRALKALEATFGTKPYLIRGGGSIPVAAMFDSILGLPPVMLGFANPDSHAHAPNESMVLDNYERGIRTICMLWDDLATMAPIQGTAT